MQKLCDLSKVTESEWHSWDTHTWKTGDGGVGDTWNTEGIINSNPAKKVWSRDQHHRHHLRAVRNADYQALPQNY